MFPPDCVNAGFYLVHPATPMPALPAAGQTLLRELAATGCFRRPRTFTSLEAAAKVARTIGQSVHGLWLEAELVERLRADEDEVTGLGCLGQILQQARHPDPYCAMTGGYDVLGLAGGEFLAWNFERTGRAAARQLGIEAATGFLPDAATAVALADLLNDDELGSPVLWRPWWHSLHTCGSA